jgi:hypothetical protein
LELISNKPDLNLEEV